MLIRASVNYLDYPSSGGDFSTVIIFRSRERFLVTVKVLIGGAGIDSIASELQLHVSLVTTLVEP